MDHLSLIVIVGYLTLTTVVGSMLARRSRGSSQWAVAGGGMGALMIAVGVAGTRIGGAGSYGVAADVIRTGMWNTWYAVYTFLAMALVGVIYAKPYRRLGLMTVSEIFIKRFGSRRLQILTSLCVQTEYLIVNIIEPFVIAKILTGVAPQLDYHVALAIAAVALISYTALGGLWGAAATNLIHCAVILIGLFAVGMMGTIQLGGFDELARGVDAALGAAGRDPAQWWSFTGAGAMAIIAMFFATTIHTPAASVYTNYSTAAREEKALARGFIAGGLIAALMPLLAAWIGAATLAKFGADAQARSYLSITQLATSVSPVIGAVALAAVLAAVVSSGGPILLASATMFVRDWIPGSREMTSDKQLRLYRITTIIYGALAAALAAKMQGSVLEWLLLGFAAVVPPAIVVTYLLYWPRATEQGAFWGIVSGYAGGVIWYLFSEYLLGFDKAALESAGGFIQWAHDFFVMESGEIVDPAYATTLIPLVVTPVVSLMTKPETARRDEFYATIKGMKRILIVDAVEWGPEHASLEFPKDVGHWISDALGGDPARFAYWRVTREAEPPAGPFAGVIISGSPASAYDDTPWINRLKQEIRRWADEKRPVLGVCFGHQILAQALGGRVVKNPAGWEVGAREVELTEEGRRDPLFAGAPERLLVMESHQDVVAEPPPGARVLAANEFGAQALAIGDSIRSVQFHPEYTPERLRFIVEPRRERLAKAGVDVDAALESIRATPESGMLLHNFEKGFILNRRGA